MKHFLILLLSGFACITVYAQDYKTTLKAGDSEFKLQHYENAMKLYWAAEAIDSSKKDEVQNRIGIVFNSILILKKAAETNLKSANEAKQKIETEKKNVQKQKDTADALRIRAEIAKKNAEELKQVAENAKAESDSLRKKAEIEKASADAARQQAVIEKDIADSAKEETKKALAKAQKLIDAFYFYEDKFALAYGPSRVRQGEKAFYYIDKEGKRVDILNEWTKAEQFTETGFAKVQQRDKKDLTFNLLLDTLGFSFAVAYNLKELDSNKTALEIYPELQDSILASAIANKPLEVLIINTKTNTNEKYWKDTGNVKKLLLSIAGLQKLAYLNMSESYIFKLPGEIGQLSHLENLILRGNRLKELPSQIGELKELQELNLYNNELDSIPEQLGSLLKLTTLNLRSNQLTELPASMKSLTNLTSLNLKSNKFKKFSTIIFAFTKLTSLDLSLNNLGSIPADIKLLTNLNYLNLSETNLKVLPDEVGQLKNLKYLYLRGNTAISEAEKERIKTLLPGCKIIF